MNATLKEAGENLEQLIESAHEGEPVYITRDGASVAEISPISGRPRLMNRDEKKAWLDSVAKRARERTLRVTNSSEEILEELRENRL